MCFNIEGDIAVHRQHCQLHSANVSLLYSPAHGRGSLRMCLNTQFTTSFKRSPAKKEICKAKQEGVNTAPVLSLFL